MLDPSEWEPSIQSNTKRWSPFRARCNSHSSKLATTVVAQLRWIQKNRHIEVPRPSFTFKRLRLNECIKFPLINLCICPSFSLSQQTSKNQMKTLEMSSYMLPVNDLIVVYLSSHLNHLSSIKFIPPTQQLERITPPRLVLTQCFSMGLVQKRILGDCYLLLTVIKVKNWCQQALNKHAKKYLCYK